MLTRGQTLVFKSLIAVVDNWLLANTNYDTVDKTDIACPFLE